MRLPAGLILLFCILQGCANKDEYHKIADNQKTIYSKGDTLEYISNAGNLARYEILKVWEGECNESMGSGESAPFDIREFQNIYIDTIGKEVSNTLQTEFSMMTPSTYCHTIKSSECISIHNIAGWFNVEVTWYDKMHKLGFQIDDTADNLTLLNRKFENVFIYRVPEDINNPEDQITTWYFTYQRGFIGFEYSNGEIFEITN